MSVKRRRPSIDDLAEFYMGGESAEAIERRLHIGHGAVWKALAARGIQRRTKREAAMLRLQRLSPAARRRLTAAARRVPRHPIREETKQLRAERLAQWRERTGFEIGRFEDVLKQLLQSRGYAAISQHPVCGYNLDLAFPPVAVEVHVAANHPSTSPAIRERLERLCQRGWHMIYVWVTAAHPITDHGADQVVALLDFAQRLPAGRGQYWVIRGTGERALPRLYNGHRSDVPTPSELP